MVRNIRTSFCLTASFVVLAGTWPWTKAWGAEDRLGLARETVGKWVETEQLISRTRADWETDKETLEQTGKLFERELQAIEEQIGKLSTNNVHVEKEREQAEALLKSSDEGLERGREFVGKFEASVLGLVPRLPGPLQEILKPLLNRIPSDVLKTRATVAERMAVVVGILNECDKFNNVVAIFSEKRRNSQGEEMAVETVYIGLGAAYFVNDSNDFAGLGTVGAGGWEWKVKPELASAVREVIQIYRNERAARFIGLPVSIQ